MTVLAILKQEFKVENFKFNWKTEEDFRQPLWQCLRGVRYVILRWILALYFLIAISLSLAVNAKKQWIFKMTSVNYMIVTVYFLYAAISVSYQHWTRRHGQNPHEKLPIKTTASQNYQSQEAQTNEPNGETDISNSLKVHWFLHNLAAVFCMYVTLTFWILIAPNKKGGYGFSLSMRTYLLLDRHGINLLLLIVDFLVNQIPFRILHSVYTSLFIGLYFIYNAIYWAITKKLIYGEILDYGKRPGTIAAMGLCAMILFAPFVQAIWFLAYILKKKLTAKNEAGLDDNCDMKVVDPQGEAQ